MNIIPALQCRSLDGWYPAQIQSSSDEDTRYVVHVNPWANRSEQHVCECKSYHYRGRCKHQAEAHKLIVAGMRWKVQKRQLTNTKRNKICPRCGGPAMWSMWESNGESE